MQGRAVTGGALALVTSGVGAAFSAAACCGLPVILAGAGVGTSWLFPVAAVAARYGTGLILFAAAALLASLLLVARTPRTCVPGALCARPGFRLFVGFAALSGLGLLVVARP
jgi:mercuric ion transport protein